MKFMLEAYNVIEKRLERNSLENYLIEYLPMVLSKTRSAKACKLCIVCINYFSQQGKWLRGRNKMCIYENNCFLFYLINDIKGRKLGLI